MRERGQTPYPPPHPHVLCLISHPPASPVGPLLRKRGQNLIIVNSASAFSSEILPAYPTPTCARWHVTANTATTAPGDTRCDSQMLSELQAASFRCHFLKMMVALLWGPTHGPHTPTSSHSLLQDTGRQQNMPPHPQPTPSSTLSPFSRHIHSRPRRPQRSGS